LSLAASNTHTPLPPALRIITQLRFTPSAVTVNPGFLFFGSMIVVPHVPFSVPAWARVIVAALLV
jgi:hypothetical protein